MKHLYFVRHGLSVMNRRGLFSGRTETPLTPEGIEQAEQAGKTLQDAGIDCIVTSPMKRAADTAELIAREIDFPIDKIITNELFMERNFGPLEGTPYAEKHDLDNTEGVENSDDVLARCQQGLDFLETLDCDNVLVVSHGAVGRGLRHLLHPEVPYHGSKPFPNAEVVQLL